MSVPVHPYDPADSFHLAARFVNQTGKHIFLTGKAGTGKTTFLKYIKESTYKKTAVVAPTGVAAINAGGVTMHSFFQLPLGPFVPATAHFADHNDQMGVADQHSLIKNIRFNSNKRELIRELELLVIDEVSMVRADVLDAVDMVLRHFRKQQSIPFGGVQVIYIGDLFQLPPVVRNEEWEILSQFYQSPFFFDALSIREAPPVFIELKKIWRQNDERFIRILNNIRNNIADYDDLEELHRHYRPGYVPNKEESYITLTTHNAKADTINQRELNQLAGKLYRFEAATKGEFNERAYPAERTLFLKEGAQIMFTRNDKGEYRRYFNGKIGSISRIEEDRIYVRFPNEPGELLLEKETWKNIRYQFNKERNEIDEEELGSFTQYPIRLAWAITIHKSQGLTFDKAIIDAGESFASGQVYVALSRLTSLDGLVLYSRIHPSCIRTDERVVAFNASELEAGVLQDHLKQEQKNYMGYSLMRSFDLSKLIELFKEHFDEYDTRQIPEKNKALSWAKELLEKIVQQNEVAEKFRRQLEQLHAMAEQNGYGELRQRVNAAHDYFIKVINEWKDSLRKHREEYRLKQRTKKYLHSLMEIETAVNWKEQWIKQAVKIGNALETGTDTTDLFTFIREQKKTPLSEPGNEKKQQVPRQKAQKGDSQRISLDLFTQGKTIAEIAKLRSLASSTVEGHLASFILTGELSVNKLVPDNKIKAILDALEIPEPVGAFVIREKLGHEFSYGEIRAVMNHKKMMMGS